MRRARGPIVAEKAKEKTPMSNFYQLRRERILLASRGDNTGLTHMIRSIPSSAISVTFRSEQVTKTHSDWEEHHGVAL